MAGQHFSSPTPRNDLDGTGVSTRRVSDRTASLTGTGNIRRAPEPPSRLPLIIGAIVAVLALAGAAVFAMRACSPAPEPEPIEMRDVTFIIPEGSGAFDVATILVENQIITDSDAFIKALTKQGADSQIKAGAYSMHTGTSIDAVIAQLIQGPNSTEHQVTIPEGKTIPQTAAIIEEGLGVSADEFVEQASASKYAADYSFLGLASESGSSLEGYLFGKTYDFAGKEITADTIIRAMLDQYAAEVDTLDFASARAKIKERYKVEMSDYDIIKMASIIEREAVTEDDRPLVASVFYNRLNEGMRLQSDATMMYVTGGEVTAEDLKQDSPYNTYLVDGFPPTPICSPSIEAIQAALEPADTDYLYFLIIENENYSNHSFSKTYEEHQAAIAKAQADQA